MQRPLDLFLFSTSVQGAGLGPQLVCRTDHHQISQPYSMRGLPGKMHHIGRKAVVHSKVRLSLILAPTDTWDPRMTAQNQASHRWDVDIVVDVGDPAWGNSSCNALIEIVEVLEVLCG